MATLHDAVDKTKKVLFVAAIIVISITVLYFLVTGIISYIRSRQTPPPPTEDFGKLPNIEFPANATTEQLTYTIDTVSGELPLDFPSRMYVYEIVQPQPDLNNLKDARRKASGAKFGATERRVSDTVYQWNAASNISRTLNLDIINGSFVYSTNFMTNSNFLASTTFITPNQAVSQAREFFQDLSSFPSDVADGDVITKQYAIVAGRRITAPDSANTKVIEVNFFQTPIVIDKEEYPIYYSKPEVSPINALVAAFETPTVVEAHYTYNAISNNYGEYWIISAKDAFEDLQAGKGYIATFFGSDTDVKINEVSLAYYIGDGIQKYAMPIYIFSNSARGFYAYVPAIDDYWNDPQPTSSEEE